MVATERRTMRAITRERYGDTEVLSLGEVERPTVGDDDVLLRVRAASVGPWDWHLMTGQPYLVHLTEGFLRPRQPILGLDAAGVVEAVGHGVGDLAPGDEVYADVGSGAFAEYVTAPARVVAPKPKSLSFEEAASLPVAGLTALQGLRNHGGLEAGQRVLVVGASGGVGTLAVQIAKALGAEVTGTCSTPNTDLVRSLGADGVIDYTRHDFTEVGERWDLIFDAVGDRPLRHCRRALTPDGVYVMVSGSKGRWVDPVPRMVAGQLSSRLGGWRFAWFVARAHRGDLEDLAAMVDAGQVRPVIERRFTLEETPEALRLQGAGHARGKKVIVI